MPTDDTRTLVRGSLTRIDLFVLLIVLALAMDSSAKVGSRPKLKLRLQIVRGMELAVVVIVSAPIVFGLYKMGVFVYQVSTLGKPHPELSTRATREETTISAALRQFKLDYRRYPTVGEGLPALIRKPQGLAVHWKGPYLTHLPLIDPWGHPFIYHRHGPGFSIISFGPEGYRSPKAERLDISVSR